MFELYTVSRLKLSRCGAKGESAGVDNSQVTSGIVSQTGLKISDINLNEDLRPFWRL